MNMDEIYYKNKALLYNKKIYINIFKFILIIFIIIIIYIIKIENNLNNDEQNNYIIKNNMIKKNLYHINTFPLISILLNCDKYLFNKNNLLNLINNLKDQTLINLRIIFLVSKFIKEDDINLIKNIVSFDKRIEIFFYKDKYIFDNICNLFNQINGKFIMLLEEYISFEKEELEEFYESTKGRINNIFNFTNKNNNSIYFIKTKILKDICDDNYSFNNFNELINYIFLKPISQVNYIPIAFCPNNYYTPLTYVSMLSILNSKDISTYISFYIVIPKDFDKKNIDFLSSLYDQYDYFNITFLIIDKRYNKAFISRHITTQAYYRFSLGELIPYLNKIIYLDSDTICFKDLTNFYNINFRGKIILGQIIITNNYKKTGYYRINSGILLLNLKEMRKIKLEEKVINIINKGYKNKFHDQAIINIYFKKYVGIFPPQYHGRPYVNYKEIVEYNKKSGKIYNNEDLYFSWKYPSIKHFLHHSKPNFHDHKYNKEDWWYFARKSKYFKKKSYNLSKIFNYFT